MAKYEIMLILDPKADEAIASKLLKDVFGEGIEKLEKLERNELAYTIKKTNIAQYFLASVESESSLIREFTRKANIIKEVWRNLVISLESERGLNRRPRENKRPQRKFQQGQYGDKFKKPYSPYAPRDQRDQRGEKREYTYNREFVKRPSGDRPSYQGGSYNSGSRTTGDRPSYQGNTRTSDRSYVKSDDKSGNTKSTFQDKQPKSDQN